MQTNYLAAVALIERTLDLVRQRRPSRIVNVASATHLSATLHLDDLNLERYPYSPVIAYSQSKLVLVTYAYWLAGRLDGHRGTDLTLHATAAMASRQELDSYSPSDPSPAYHAAMSFFEPPASPPGPVSRAMVVSPPPWLGPPLNALPGIAPVELVIARTDDTVAALAGIQAYPAGFGFTLCLRLRTVSAREEQQFPYLLDRVPVGGDPLPDELLRFGVQFADGRKATNLDRPAYDPDQEPDRPVLHPHGGGGGGSAWDMGHWVWPLPPNGPLGFVCEWPGRGIAESRVEIDAASILEAAGRAVTLWSDE